MSIGVFTGILNLSFYPKTCEFGWFFFLGSCSDVGHVSNSRMSLHGFDGPEASVKGTPSFPYFFQTQVNSFSQIVYLSKK